MATARQRKFARRLLALGATLTLLVTALDALGAFGRLERALYDARCESFQFFVRPPTDKLVHLDIDDAAINVLGKWPWPRWKLAAILDEVSAAGPKVIALDVLLGDESS